jgi:MFS family permease
MLVIAARTEFIILSFAALGLVSGISAGPIMSLPARVLGPETRASGMGIYFTILYLMGVGGPIAAGKAASIAGTSRIAFDVGAAMLAGCVIVYCMFRKVIEHQVAVRSARPS